MAGESQITTNHDEIRRWVEARAGRPAIVKGTEDNSGGMLRINFSGFGTRSQMREIVWEEFFRIFEDRKIAFLFQERKKDGSESRFFKFVSRD